MRARVRRHNLFARQLAAAVEASPVLELLAPVSLSISCFRYVPKSLRDCGTETQLLNALNREILKRLHREHRYTPSSTELHGMVAIRPCYINPRTQPADVEGLILAVERLGQEVWEEHQRGTA
jgi:aromatic-L-amino-acid/L-tryptophan decarboxylase